MWHTDTVLGFGGRPPACPQRGGDGHGTGNYSVEQVMLLPLSEE